MLIIRRLQPGTREEIKAQIPILQAQLGQAFQSIQTLEWELDISKLVLHEGARRSPHVLTALDWHGWKVMDRVQTE